MGDDSLEIEVKFLVQDLAVVRDRLLKLGARQHKPRIHERNLRFDNPWDGLREQGKLLRLRQDDKARLTYKGEPSVSVDSEARVREELEVEVGDFPTMQALLQRIGFEAKQEYEKYRETFIFGRVEVVLDEMPFGDFVELEGPDAAIRTTAESLGLDWSTRILADYLTIMARLQEQFGLDFDDVTFENFAKVNVSALDLLAG